MLKAFVAMPIKEIGSPEFLHFRALYDDVIQPSLQAAGYDSTRADDIQRTGAVTKDIIRRLAEADLVVADLSDLNPNVFYELGIRHALRGSGTIMMLDQARTRGLPFDIMPYRAILYTSDVPGIAKLRTDLRALASGVSSRSVEHRDSPVHDAVSVLPVDVLSSAAGSVDRAMSEELAALRGRLRDYEHRFGVSPADSNAGDSSPLDTVLEALGKAERGELLTDLVKHAEAAGRQHNTRMFLEHVHKVLAQQGVGLAAGDYTRLAQGARGLGLVEVANAVYEAGVAAHPHNDGLRAMYLGELAHSPDPRARERARAELLTACGLALSADGDLEIPDQFQGRAVTRVGVMLDAYHADRLHGEALRITTSLVERLPAATAIVRNHARALKEVGAPQDEVTQWYRRAILCPDADNSSAQWFGNHMFNSQRYVDAVETYLLALTLDPEDATAFADLLHSGALARRRQLTGVRSQPREMPSELDAEFFGTTLLAAFSCSVVTQRDHDDLMKHAQLAEIAPEIIETAMSQQSGGAKVLSFQQRYEFARNYYEILRSPLTQPEHDESGD